MARALRILFFLGAINYDRVFEGLLRELLARDHEITIVLGQRKLDLPVGAGEIFPSLAAEFDGRLRWESLELEPTPREVLARELRQLLDYLRYLEPEYRTAAALRERSRGRVRPRIAAAVDLLGKTATGRRIVVGAVRAVERALPAPVELAERIRREHADVVMVAPLITLGSPQADVLRAAHDLGLPTVFPVASWDNLTNKGLVRDVPDRTIVWNADQVEEAVRLQSLPRERVHAVGAHAYDHWFAWQPSTSFGEFAEKVGLDPATPFFLYACSSAFIAGDESTFLQEWLERLRSVGGELASAGVLVRPHPQNVAIWRDVDLGDDRAVVWPVGGEVPTDAQRKSDYFDSLHHSRGVIGINTSALIEAAIARRAVFTVATERYRHTQSGTLHFGYLADGNGVLNVASGWDEHFAQLAAAYADPEHGHAKADAFLKRFVRPEGLDTPAAPLAADVVERAAAEGAAVARAPSRVARGAARLLVAVAEAHRTLKHR